MECYSPSVLNKQWNNENNVTQYEVEITLNAKDYHWPSKTFYYYKDTLITWLDPIFWPLEWGTTIKLFWQWFSQSWACNITARFWSYQVHPTYVEENMMTLISPAANFTWSVTIQVALNWREFDRDILVWKRDPENTFYYYAKPMIRAMTPRKWPTNWWTKIQVFGVWLDDIFSKLHLSNDRRIFYRFIDARDNSTQYWDIWNTTVEWSHVI